MLINESKDPALLNQMAIETENIHQKIAEYQSIPEAGISPDHKVSKYDREKKARQHTEKLANFDFIRRKHEQIRNNMGVGITQSQR